MRNFKLEGTWN